VKLLSLVALLATSLYGQGSFYALGMSGLPQSSPKPTGWGALAIQASAKYQVWSISGIDFSLVGKPLAVQTSAWTGIATPLRTFGPFTFYALGAGGAATVGTASGRSLTGGMIAYAAWAPGHWYSHAPNIFGYAIENSTVGGTQNLIKLGYGATAK
jgi:hypothetical protein